MQRLLHHTADLIDHTEGLSVRISHVNYVAPDGSNADIAWNFEL